MIKILFNEEGTPCNDFKVISEASRIVKVNNEEKIDQLIHTSTEDLLRVIMTHVRDGSLKTEDVKVYVTIDGVELEIRHDNEGGFIDEFYSPDYDIFQVLFK